MRMSHGCGIRMRHPWGVLPYHVQNPDENLRHRATAPEEEWPSPRISAECPPGSHLECMFSPETPNFRGGCTRLFRARRRATNGLATLDTSVNAPSVFGKSLPTHNATAVSISPSLSWNTSSGATSYEYCYDTTNDTVCDSSWINVSTNTSVNLTSLPTGTTYYWHMRAKNGDGVIYSDGDTWWSFTTEGTATTNVPDINVKGNEVSITNGDTTPVIDDHTNFGSVNTAGNMQDRTFTIKNLGTAPLILSGTPKVVISGVHASDFTVTIQPSDAVVVNGSTTFTVRFDPSVIGMRTANISIVNNDPNKNPYTFAIQGIGINSDKTYLPFISR